MKGLFIKADDEIVVKIFLANGKDGRLYSDIDKLKLVEVADGQVEESQVEEHEVIFKKPSFGDRTKILSKATSILGDGANGVNINIDIAVARFKAMSSLIKRWSFKDDQGNPLPVTEANIYQMDPIVATMIAVQFDNGTGGII